MRPDFLNSWQGVALTSLLTLGYQNSETTGKSWAKFPTSVDWEILLTFIVAFKTFTGT